MLAAMHWLGSVVLALGCAGQEAQSSSSSTVPGPEATDLVARTHGWIALTIPVGGIQTIRLPELAEAMPREPDTGLLPVHSLAGPDSLGRIAFVENDMLEERHALELLQPDGATTAVFEGRGDALWDHAVGKHLALNPQGTRIALVARAKGVELRDPDAYWLEGELEIWQVDERKRSTATVAACDDALSWLPDGKRLFYTALIERGEALELLATHSAPDDAFARATLKWKRVPAVHVLDAETGQSRALHVGERPIASPDGQLVLLRDFESHWRILDLESGRSTPFEAPGAVTPGAIAFVDPHTVLYWARPTEGSELRYTEHNSPLVGKKPMRALKLVDLRDGRFQTVVPFVDPRRSVSFGMGAP
jgi:hypothetical protein